jgi:hypothetical protein
MINGVDGIGVGVCLWYRFEIDDLLLLFRVASMTIRLPNNEEMSSVFTMI